ncbi:MULTISPECIES: ABC transporter substrate-binding protein [unclassified Burkholderia]|uniref:ABC transporter substrate-binding protein n=1 Tax=unclassified Burkholderia TaxID=2613784 RepID=UPI000757005A|nr:MULTISPECIES: ABC transporter substrate-binding protein [unclassified Burkholderia]KVN07019.1 ABC transporter permease [Burkholderia sp. MSMB1552]KWZ51422.1 ABC transporter permease [Burkholderia sp. MSMB1588]
MDELIAVSSMEHAELTEFVDGMSAQLGVIVRLVRWSTAELAERLRCDDAGPWDILLGTAATALLDPAIVARLTPLDEIDFAGLPSSAIAEGRRWFSPSGFVPTFCYDAKLLSDHGLAAPTLWKALASPIWSGRLALPDPSRSGADYLHLSALVEHRGEAAWQTLAAVARLRPSISGSSTTPIDDVLAGRAWVAATVSTAATRAARAHPTLRWLVPDDARCYEYEVFALRAGSPRVARAQRALAWMLSHDASTISRRYGKVVLGETADPTASMPSLRPLNVFDASRAKAERTAHWHTLFTEHTNRD